MSNRSGLRRSRPHAAPRHRRLHQRGALGGKAFRGVRPARSVATRGDHRCDGAGAVSRVPDATGSCDHDPGATVPPPEPHIHESSKPLSSHWNPARTRRGPIRCPSTDCACSSASCSRHRRRRCGHIRRPGGARREGRDSRARRRRSTCRDACGAAAISRSTRLSVGPHRSMSSCCASPPLRTTA